MTQSKAQEKALFSRLDRMFESALNNMLSELHALRDEIIRLDGEVNAPETQKEIKRLLKRHDAERVITDGLASAGAAASAAITSALVGALASSMQAATDDLQAQAKADLSLMTLSTVAVSTKPTRQERKSHKKLSSRATARTRSKKAIKNALARTKDPADFLPFAIALAIAYTRTHARTLTRTEQTRVKGYVVQQIGAAAAALGLRIYKQWHCRMLINSRDPHVERDGLCAMIDEPFPGSVMHYPGDPAGGPGEVCNCVCTMSLHILGKNDRIVDGHLIKGRDE